jgi:hypothetical protein
MEAGQFALFAGILLLALLLLLGGAIVVLRSRRQPPTGEQAPPSTEPTTAPGTLPATAPAEPSAPARLEQLSNRLSDWQRKLPPDVVLLSRDQATGEWLVEVDGQRYRRLGDIHDNRAATKILSAIEGMKSFAGLLPTEPPPPSPPSPAQSIPAPAAPDTAASARAARAGLATYPAPEGSIIAQIETLLQREIALNHDLADRNIHMGAAPDGSLLIEIDSHFYKSPNDIPEPKVRELVLRAVRTWERAG